MTRLGAVACVLAVACSGESTGPGADGSINITLESVGGPASGSDLAGVLTLTCTAHITAFETGTLPLTWGAGLARLSFGADRSHFVDSIAITPDNVIAAFGAPPDAAHPVRSGWQITAYLPYTLQLAFSYTPVGQPAKVARISADCGPHVTAASRRLVVSALTLRLDSAVVQNGDAVTVEYAAQSDFGLMSALIRLSGPCELTANMPVFMQASVVQQARFVIPPDCALGTPFLISVRAKDGAGGDTLAGATTPTVLVDHRPPTLSVGFVSDEPTASGALGTRVYSVGDSILTSPGAADNHWLRHIVWDLLPAGVRDSVPVSGFAPVAPILIPIPGGVDGPQLLRLTVRDLSGLSSAPYTSRPGQFAVVPKITRLVRTAALPSPIMYAIVDAQRDAVYIVTGDQFFIMSLATMTLQKSVVLTTSVSNFDLSLSGDSIVFATDDGSQLGAIDVRATTPVVSFVPFAPGAPHGFGTNPRPRMGSNGHFFVPSGETLFEVDLATGVATSRSDLSAAGIPGGSIERSGDASTLIFQVSPTQFTLYTVATGHTVVITSPHAHHDHGPSLDYTGAHVAIDQDVYDVATASWSVVSVPFISALDSELTADGAYVLNVVPTSGLVRTRVSDGQITDRTVVPVASRCHTSVEGWMYVCAGDPPRGSGSKTIVVVDLR